MAVVGSKYKSVFSNTEWRKENAVIILSILMKFLPKINSVVDFGCGAGAWLSVFKDLGIKEIKGYDGYWADKESLVIPKECFTTVDLSKEIFLEKKYDLAISLEVAEHLPEKSAKNFVGMLTKSSDIILFSAAIPFQGGEDHVNEQWQNYWYNLFNEFGYVGIDVIRSLIWDNEKIKTWFKQNMILYVKKDMSSEIKIPDEYSEKIMRYINIIHPEMYNKHISENKSLTYLYKMCIKKTIKKIIGKKVLGRIKNLLKQKNGT